MHPGGDEFESSDRPGPAAGRGAGEAAVRGAGAAGEAEVRELPLVKLLLVVLVAGGW